MKKAIVVGSGAGGATVARELQGAYDVTVLEAGGEFRPFQAELSVVGLAKKAGLMFDEREISFMFPSMNIIKARKDFVLVRGIGLGGTTTIATGNGLRLDDVLRRTGIDLSSEYDELEREIPISTSHSGRWHKTTRRLFDVCKSLGLDPEPTPKMGEYQNCLRCGRCVLGCRNRAKWDSRRFLSEAVARGAKVVTRSRVTGLRVEGSRATGVFVHRTWRPEFIPADLIVLAAGGFETPAILENSGIPCDRSLFVDPVLCLAAPWKGACQENEIAMPFVVQRPGFILSPYLDYLSYFFRKDWKSRVDETLSLMIKISDSNVGSVNGRIEKELTEEDGDRLRQGVELCHEIFHEFGIERHRVAFGTLNAGHPGGTLPLRGNDTTTFHPSRLPANLYAADATLIPTSLGNPPMLTIMAMAKRVARACKTIA